MRTVCSGLQVSPPSRLSDRVTVSGQHHASCQVESFPHGGHRPLNISLARAQPRHALRLQQHELHSVEHRATCLLHFRPTPTHVLRKTRLEQHGCRVHAGVEALELHPLQAASVDEATRSSNADAASRTLTVPARTAAVFVTPR